jgi:phosphate transport system substrate-binding protein
MHAERLWRRWYRHGHALAIAIAIALLLGFAVRGTAADAIRIGGSGSTLGTMQLLADAFAKQDPEFRAAIVPNLGSSGGIRALAAGAIGLAATSRPLRDAERKLGLAEIEYGRTPFVFAVTTRSMVTAITLRQLADIYGGKTASWPDGTPIRIVLRPASDIDTDMVKGVSPELRQALSVAEQRPGVAFSVTDQDAANDIEKIPGAIGPSSLALILSEKRSLRALKLEGVEPTAGNIASGVYRYHKRMFLVIGAKRPPAVQRFIAFIRSPAGRRILTQTGHWIP